MSTGGILIPLVPLKEKEGFRLGKVLLEMKNITKTFPGVKALDNVNLKVEEGEIHALVGENGAGKSTLMNVLSGVYTYGTYEGDIIYDGEVCKFNKIKDSEEKGIVIIHQELALVPEMTIGENMYLGNEQGKKFSIDWSKTYGEADEYLAKVGLHESSRTLIKDIGVGKQQLVEIAKALAKHAKLLILDEPTSSLNESDSKALLDLMLEFKKQGMTMIIITHKLNEVAYVADKITVIRDGSTIETMDKRTDEITEDRIIKGMVGRELTDRFPKRKNVKNISGELYINGKEVKLHTVKEAIEHKIAYVTEDRKGNGLILSNPIRVNTTLANLDGVSSHGVIDRDKEIAVAEEYRQKMRTKCPSVEQNVGNLSGGNQQKVLLAKWMFAGPDVLILDEPTRGIDVGAKYEIYCIINDLVAAGKSVIMISSELPEVLGMSDRIYVMNEGRIVGELDAAEASQEVIMGRILSSSKGE